MLRVATFLASVLSSLSAVPHAHGDAQEVDVLAYRPRFAVRSRKQFRGLIARMLTNDLADKARRASARPQRATLAQLSESRVSLVVDGSFTAPDAAAERSEDVAWLRLGVDFLDDESRELILRHVFEGETFVSIAETTAWRST